MYNYSAVDISEARKNLSKLVDKAYLTGEIFILLKRNIPLVKISRVDTDVIAAKEEKKIDLSLFGVFRDKRSSAVSIASNLRKKSWKRL
ncbi:hypothetical protein A2767_01315 [Candidatus Roizmanbacteria bacterium RIFCSPHIGHO2_01_FULL_35_10]|uniref:Antitoxin n=1 Tax=Candidatus Roizmanbacteria bacterium RIFCSPLOWO2_01_FULL_35_13 TaxID=1802055 RepID=A0A1F7I7Z8_9BACT|nr:MAG: hypothetical protein A2767_01315 [Candidatus Roizmanbacteria bacterium RIFCSPHIGHO2_01_FULL_35_10]OGK39402.1 MAG: hypothetical protein A3A74_06220 [Candidatus Roizmanbacteria bacterium RIFCSPLOWO2_01_FULL_35_13]